eukprot:gi/632976316/ref/XP_007904729.1/ PREDICTED: melanoma antigen recognized by T-cells 1 isoform X2 [Callorhinchus milii]
MPKQDFTLQGVFGLGRDGPYLRAEEAIGIGLLVLILAILLIIGCWYYKRRNGYMMLQVKRLFAEPTHVGQCHQIVGGTQQPQSRSNHSGTQSPSE